MFIKIFLNSVGELYLRRRTSFIAVIYKQVQNIDELKTSLIKDAACLSAVKQGSQTRRCFVRPAMLFEIFHIISICNI